MSSLSLWQLRPNRKIPRADGSAAGLRNHKLCQYIRGQSSMALRAVAQAARRFSAADLPIRRSATMSKLTFCPSLTCSCRAFNRADMNKDVTAAVGELNEAEALLAVKPLHSSC